MTTSPVPNDWIAGTSPTAATLNTYIVNAVQYLLSPPAFRAYGTPSQAVPANTPFNPTWVVQEDTASGFSTAHNYYVAQQAGWYSVTSTITVSNLGSVVCSYNLVLGINGVQQPPVMYEECQTFANPAALALYADIYLQQGDYVYPAFITPAAGTVYTTAQQTSFEATWFGV